jgi:hypothetical protein
MIYSTSKTGANTVFTPVFTRLVPAHFSMVTEIAHLLPFTTFTVTVSFKPSAVNLTFALPVLSFAVTMNFAYPLSSVTALDSLVSLNSSGSAVNWVGSQEAERAPSNFEKNTSRPPL